MQNFELFSIYDVKAKTYASPYLSVTVDSGKRLFETLLRERGSSFSMYPTDFVLYHLGSFSDRTASFNLFPSPVLIATGSEFFHPVMTSASVASQPDDSVSDVETEHGGEL